MALLLPSSLLLLTALAPLFQDACLALKLSTGPPEGEYIWPSGNGRVGFYTSSWLSAPRNLSSTLSWSWHDERGRYMNVPNGALVDEKSDIYLHSLDGLRKFHPSGEKVWTWTVPERGHGEEMPDMSSLYAGAIYTTTTWGRVFAVSMETGETLWNTTVAGGTDPTNGWVSAGEGMVIFSYHVPDLQVPQQYSRRESNMIGDKLVAGVNATDGTLIWKFRPDAPVWNFLASFAGDGTFTFQDFEGRLYRNSVKDGTLIWKRGGVKDSWTDGSSVIGENGVAYTVSNKPHFEGRDSPGSICAWRLSDGKLLWNISTPRPPNNRPSVGRLAGHAGLSLVQPIGQQCEQGNPTDIYAFDAETGGLQWVFEGPAQRERLQAGDSNERARKERIEAGVREITLPNPWSGAAIDGSGVVFVGNEEGGLYSLQDADGDGKVKGPAEVSEFDTGACFSGSSTPAIAQDMLVAASIDALYVFRG